MEHLKSKCIYNTICAIKTGLLENEVRGFSQFTIQFVLLKPEESIEFCKTYKNLQYNLCY